jgi:hypothetical protein
MMKTLLFILTTVMVAAVYAQTPTSTASKVINPLSRLAPDRISHFSIFSGPGINNPRPFKSDGTENMDGANSWHQISLGYNINKNTRFVVNPRFTIDYTRTQGEGEENRPTGALDEPVVGITSTWYKNGKLTFAGGLNTILFPVTEGNKKDQRLLNPGGFQTLNYQVTNRFSIGSWLWARYVYEANSNDDPLPMFVEPFVNYIFTDKLSFTGFYHYDASIDDENRFSVDTTDFLSLSIQYRLTKNLNLQPMIQSFRATGFDLAQSNINLWVSGSFK